MKHTLATHPTMRIMTSLLLSFVLASSALPSVSSAPLASAPNPDPNYLRSGPALADLNLGAYSGFTLGDVDGDGDVDALAGDMTGRLLFFRNSGGPNVGSNFFRELDQHYPVGLHPSGPGAFDYSDTGLTYVHPELIDHDIDGDQDLFVGAIRRVAGGTSMVVDYYRNDSGVFTKHTGTSPTVPSITRIPDAVCRNIDDYYDGDPEIEPVPWLMEVITLAVGDLTKDGVLDAVVGVVDTRSGTPQYQLRIYAGVVKTNTPDNDCPVLISNYNDQPWALKTPRDNSRPFPELFDADQDGDLDLFVGLASGVVQYFENMPTISKPNLPFFILKSGPDHPLNLPGETDPNAEPDFGSYVVPEFGFLDTDMRIDFAALSGDGQVFAMRFDQTLEEPHLVPWQTPADFLMPLDAGGRIVGIDPAAGAVTFADLDGDGDQDALTGHKDGVIRNYKNLLAETGQRRFVELSGNDRWFFANFGLNSFAVPLLANFDGQLPFTPLTDDVDLVIAANVANCPENISMASMSILGADTVPPPSDLELALDMNLLGGTSGGNSWALCYYENAGSGLSPDFQLKFGPVDPVTLKGTNDPFREITLTDTYLYPAVVAADDYETYPDLVIGTANGGLLYLHNLGDDVAPFFESRSPSEVNLPASSIPYGTPAFKDVDGDSSPDLVIGSSFGRVRYFHNDQEPDVEGVVNYPIGPFTEITGAGNPFSFIDTGSYSAPAFADVDADGDLDLVTGSVLNAFRFHENVTPSTPGSPLAFIDYRFNPLAQVIPPDYSVNFLRSVNFADFDSDGDLDAFVGGQVASEQYGAAYYRNVGTPAFPVFRQQAQADNPFSGIVPNTIINVTLADTHPSKPGKEAYVGGSVGGTGYLLAYEYNEITGKYVIMDPQPFTNPLSTNYGVGPRATFRDIDGDGDLDCFAALGYKVATINGIQQNYGILLLWNEPDDDNEARFISPSLLGNGYTDNFRVSSNPFYILYEFRYYFYNQHSMNTTMVDDSTWWVGNDAGQVHTLLNAFYDEPNQTTYIDRVTDRRDPFKNVKLPNPTIPTAADTNADGFVDAYVASSNGTIQYFKGSVTPPPSAGLVFLPLIRR